MSSFKHFDLKLLSPSFESDLVDIQTELEKLRYLRIHTDVHPFLFSQLKHIFHMLESLGSARIEGNHTTLADYIDSKVEKTTTTDQLSEIRNIEIAMEFIDDNLQADDVITEQFIRELHALTVDKLDVGREGDKTPGAYRSGAVRISQSEHLPPAAISVSQYMSELVGFINNQDKPKYDLMKMALAHHRFGWIHPFSNGNGRTVRLLTYALLIKYGFNVQAGGRVLNPTAVFCNDRDKYYEMLSLADLGTDENLEKWCIYVLSGILEELKKVDQLTDLKFLSEKILFPALNFSVERQLITELEKNILVHAVLKGTIKAGDLSEIDSKLSSRSRTYEIKQLVDKRMLEPIQKNARIYTASFTNSYLMRGVVKALYEQGFIKNLD